PVDVSIDQAQGVLGASLEIQYNPTVALATGVSATALTTNCEILSNLNTPGEARIALACSTALSGAGALVTVAFQGQSNKLGTLHIANCSLNEDAIPCTTSDGGIAVARGTCGDVNGDGLVDVVDALLVTQQTVGLRSSLACPLQADVNQSGAADIVDA